MYLESDQNQIDKNDKNRLELSRIVSNHTNLQQQSDSRLKIYFGSSLFPKTRSQTIIEVTEHELKAVTESNLKLLLELKSGRE